MSLPQCVLEEFETHAGRVRDASRSRKAALEYRNLVEDDQSREALNIVDTLGKRQPVDAFDGCVNLRTLRTLLKMVDERGWERSPHQVAFHSSFERCVSRVLYKSEWATSRPAIMTHNGWAKCSSEVLISIAIFCAALALTMGVEIVVFSPARRASRKLLERMVEFIRVLDCDDRIVEYNQEACRVTSYNGKRSLIRSFPSKVGVRCSLRLKPGPGEGADGFPCVLRCPCNP